MSVMSASISIFKTRRHNLVYAPAQGFFYASWFLLRMRAENLILNPERIRYHWQRVPFSWRRKGALRKARKNFSKNHQRKTSH